MRKKICINFLLLILSASILHAQKPNKFRQLEEDLPTANTYRTASGAPGHQYWQQKADYKMDIRLDDDKQRIYGEEEITYTNNSPDVLSFVWLQLDQNILKPDSDSKLTETMKITDQMSYRNLRSLVETFDGGFKIEQVTDENNQPLKHTYSKTNMRIDLKQPLQSKGSVKFRIKWWYNIHDGATYGGRTGYEFFPDDKNYVYSVAQFYPRMCAYLDNEGWQTNQYLGTGEFTLSFGDYEVNITVPEDHIVAATGELKNPTEVLTAKQRERLEKAKTANEPVLIVTQDEAIEAEKQKKTGSKTWQMKATNVRDFAFASSRKHIWDAQGIQQKNKFVMAMSYYPKEGNPLWGKYSTKAVVHTIKTYSKFTFEYPYPVAISTHASFTGMEYPMICFNFGRPEKDGTYNERIKYGMLGVIIHEVGHNYFPMIVNSDERQWAWMDEGLNSFIEYLTEQEWERTFPCRRGPAFRLTDYMKSDKNTQSPIMENADVILQLGNNSYGKPAVALNILRETVLGRELFDFAFKEYSNRWMFKHPSPADFFRTMEEASGVDLDWFWRGWFYTNDHVDISLEKVQWFKLNTKNPKTEMAQDKLEYEEKDNRYISSIRNLKDIKQTVTEKDPSTLDFYNSGFRFSPNPLDEQDYQRYLSALSPEERKLLEANNNLYQLDFKNIGGLISPVIIQFDYTDGTTELVRLPAEIWRYDNDKFSKVFLTKKTVKQITLDPFLETADVDTNNNNFPAVSTPSRFQLFKANQTPPENPMQRDVRSKKQ